MSLRREFVERAQQKGANRRARWRRFGISLPPAIAGYTATKRKAPRACKTAPAGHTTRSTARRSRRNKPSGSSMTRTPPGAAAKSAPRSGQPTGPPAPCQHRHLAAP